MFQFGAKSIIDCGCGDGTFLYFINKYFDLKIGMEIDLDNVNNLNKHFQELGGHNIIISVPKETGLTMIGKQLVRKVLAYRKTGTYEYSEWYTITEFF